MSSGVTVASMRAGLLMGPLANPKISAVPTVDMDASIQAAIHHSEAAVERELGTRFAVTSFEPYMGAAEPVALTGAAEYEAPYDWPGQTPGDGFTRIRTRIRPLVSVSEMKLTVPGSLLSVLNIPTSWLRLNRILGEIMVAPSGGNAVYALAYGQGMLGWRLPASLGVKFRAGLGTGDLDKWPQLVRLVELKATIRLMAGWSFLVNPSGLSSVSADGLSQTRSSGYVFKDMEDRLANEITALSQEMHDLWDGPGGGLMVL